MQDRLGLASGPDGNTPLDPDEADELLPVHLVNRGQLDAWEQANIALAHDWVSRKRSVSEVLEQSFLRELHRRMFSNTWRWAGQYRGTEKSIGVVPHAIAGDVHDLLNDVAHWAEHGIYPLDEIAARFHHRLVQIHPFANGNGRHARLAADVLLIALGATPFTWGAADLTPAGESRTAYLRSLKAADQGDLSELMRFARS